jgi:formylglycine-generating enzyme required for sulfatase activity
MVPITGPPSDAGSLDYKIDMTEVTKGQYDAWLATNPVLPPSTDPNCGYVTSYAEQGTFNVYTGIDAEHHPVVYVDWCDAYAYCSGVEKRLCGTIGGGSVEFSSRYDDASNSQWFRTCSSGGANTYPYGNTYQGRDCNGGDYGAGQTKAVGSLSVCVTSTAGYAGAYDLSGNVEEWEDSCAAGGQLANCHLRGGAFAIGVGSGLSCYSDDYMARSDVDIAVGFRCCT